MPSTKVELTGFLGRYAELSYRNRVKTFITGPESEPVQIWAPEFVKDQYGGDWYGEHAGKWLVTACNWLQIREDADLRESVRSVCEYFLSIQEDSGAWSCYAADAQARFTDPVADTVRTWDIWILANLMLGLQRASELLDEPRILAAIDRLVELFADTFIGTGRRITNQGNHQGLSSAILLEPLAKQWLLTHRVAARAMVDQLLEELTDDLGLELIPRLTSGQDVALIGTGKIYQMLWVGVGLIKAYEATEDDSVLSAAAAMWDSVASNHLTPQGGPWGGVATHKEVFNAAGYFDPGGFVETCSIMVWNQLSIGLYEHLGASKYLDSIERTTYNQLVGAQDANGADWCYFSFPNGRRHNTYYWACCKSSGALALSEAVGFAMRSWKDECRLNFIESGVFDLALRSGVVQIRSTATHTEAVSVTCKILATPSGAWCFAVRHPEWCTSLSITVNGQDTAGEPGPDGYVRIHRCWLVDDEVTLRCGTEVSIHPAVQSVNHHGQEVVQNEFFCVSYGPFSMATGLIDGYRKFETIRVANLNGATMFKYRQGGDLPALDLMRPGQSSIRFVPYAEAGGAHDEAWRLTWIGVAWQ